MTCIYTWSQERKGDISWHVSVHDHRREKNDISIKFLYLQLSEVLFCFKQQHHTDCGKTQLQCNTKQSFICSWRALQPQCHLTTNTLNKTAQWQTLHIYFTQHKDNAIYTTFNTDRGPFIVSPENADTAAVSLLQTSAAGTQPYRSVSHVTPCYTDRSWSERGCEILYAQSLQ